MKITSRFRDALTTIHWGVIIAAPSLLLTGIFYDATPAPMTRTYWPVDLATYAQKGTAHTHVELSGYVTYTLKEGDGDVHIRVCDSASVAGMNLAHCIVAECIPKLPCAVPHVGAHVRVRGISRRDPEHSNWAEVHPVEELAVLP